jgi:hypothetical protein
LIGDLSPVLIWRTTDTIEVTVKRFIAYFGEN